MAELLSQARNNMRKLNKAVVAMSGGVDSSVAAVLLKRVNFNVIGVFMKLADSSRFKEAERRAKKIAKILNIPFLSLDLRKEFKKRVIDYFLKEYKKGNTPNPCVACNKKIKFGLLLEKALALEADFVATGHYAKKQKTENRKQKIEYKLLRAKDKNKDQSYFLWQLNQNQLKHILFPLGNYTKTQVKQMAKIWNLPVLEKESQEICFIPKSLDQFLESKLKAKKGKILTLEDKTIGEHKGLASYTIGQRKGIELPGGPFYVVAKDFKRNTLIVTSFFNDKVLFGKSLLVKNVNWISPPPKFGGGLKIKAQIRYGHKPVSATITKKIKEGKIELIFSKSQRAITPGQSVVFYQGQELLGGGIIC